MTDRIILDSMVFQGTHGVYAEEQQTPQPFEVDVELRLNLQPAGLSDDLEQTVDYSRVFDTCRQIVESTRFNLIEALAEAIAHEILAGFPADEVIISTHPPQRSRWLERGVVDRARRDVDLPVTHVVVDLEAEAAARV